MSIASAVREHPILFSAPMIRAILNTRIGSWPPESINPAKPCKAATRRLSKQWLKVKAGDRLWVRETYAVRDIYDDDKPATLPSSPECACLHYMADGPKRNTHGKTRPGIFMPRWASRILLEATEDAREERLQDLTEDEARLEGADAEHWVRIGGEIGTSYRMGFRRLWESLHTKPGERWEENPALVRVAFRRLQ